MCDVPRDDAARLPWSDMAGMPGVVVHQYFGIDAALAWRAASVSVPRLPGSLGR